MRQKDQIEQKDFFEDASIKPCNNIKKETNKDNVIDVNNASCK